MKYKKHGMKNGNLRQKFLSVGLKGTITVFREKES